MGCVEKTRYLCQLAGVSPSGYYRWIKAEESRQLQQAADEQDYELVKRQFDTLHQQAGALVIKMQLYAHRECRNESQKIRRIMRKCGLIAQVRQSDPYRKMMKATQEHNTCPNLVKRQFNQGELEKILLTDITYLRYGNGQWAYLSCIKDGATRQILAHYLSTSLSMSLVERTLENLLERLGGNIHPEAILHSDQGLHYTNAKFQQRVSAVGLTQSMSRKGKCWDNASMESFFGHMKDELLYKDCLTIEDVRSRVDQYIEYYNSARYQWTLKKMTPDEFRSHLLSA